MRHFPTFLDLAARQALVIGEGPAALRKAALLAAAGAVVRLRASFAPGDLHGACIAVGAEAPEAELQALSAAARAAGIPVNVVDRPELCSFIMPAIVDRSPVVVAISTGGAAPVLARLLRARIEAALPPGIAGLAEVAGSVAAELRAMIPELSRRRRVLERALAGATAELAFAGRAADARAALLQAARDEAPVPGIVHFVAAPAEPDLLTLRAQRVLGEADTVLHDAGVPAAVLESARRDAERRPAAATGAEAATLAAAGQRVVRLVLGEAEAAAAGEATALRAAGVAFDVVPGVAAPPRPAPPGTKSNE